MEQRGSSKGSYRMSEYRWGITCLIASIFKIALTYIISTWGKEAFQPAEDQTTWCQLELIYLKYLYSAFTLPVGDAQGNLQCLFFLPINSSVPKVLTLFTLSSSSSFKGY